MKQFNEKKFAIASLVTGSLLVGGLALAGYDGDRGKGFYTDKAKHSFGRHGKAGHGKFRSGMRGLDLTADQKKSMIDVQDKYKDQFRSLRERMKEARKGVHQAMTFGNDLESAAQIQAELVRERIILGGQVRNDIHAILTDEQKAKIEERRTKRKARMEQRKQRKEST